MPMNIRMFFVALLVFVLHQQETYSQLGFSHELGVITGPVVFYSDFGQRNDIETNMGNVGYGVGLIHYLNFAYRADCNCYTRESYFNDHFKLRNEISYHKTNLEHLGRWVDPSKTSIKAEQLRNMKGSTSVFDIGSQLEYFPLSIRDFMAGSYKLAPFVSLGAHWVNYDPEVYSEMGRLGTQRTTPDKYFDAYTNEPGTTWSIVWSAGTRYKLTPLSDLMIDARWQFYFSNWVEGLNPDVPENMANDWIFWLNIGYVLYLD